MNQRLSELQHLTNKAIKTKEKKTKKIKEIVKQATWTILMITLGSCWTITYYQWQVFYCDYLKAEVQATRIIENRSDGMVSHPETEPIEQPVSQEKVTSDTSLEGRTPEQIIEETAQQHGYNNTELLKKIAFCESTYRTDAQNENSTATGLFQFTQGTWEEGCRATGNDWTLEDRKDPEKATRMAIYFIAKGQLSRWNASQLCWNS